MYSWAAWTSDNGNNDPRPVSTFPRTRCLRTSWSLTWFPCRSRAGKLAGKEHSEINCGLGPAGGAAGYQLAATFRHLMLSVQVGFAYVLHYDVDTFPVSEASSLLGNLLLIVVDDVIGAQFMCQLTLALSGRRCDYAG